MANVFVLAKAYQKKHPRTSWQDCILAVSKKKSAAKKVSGISKRKVTKVTTTKERYTISGFKQHQFQIITNEGSFKISSKSRAEAISSAKMMIKKENAHRAPATKKLIFKSAKLIS